MARAAVGGDNPYAFREPIVNPYIAGLSDVDADGADDKAEDVDGADDEWLKRRTILYFTASWCRYCEAVSDLIELRKKEGWKVGEFSEKAKRHVQVIDADKRRDLLRKHRVSSLPCLLFIEDGKVKRRLNGRHSDERTNRAFDEWFSKDDQSFRKAPNRGRPPKWYVMHDGRPCSNRFCLESHLVNKHGAPPDLSDLTFSQLAELHGSFHVKGAT